MKPPFFIIFSPDLSSATCFATSRVSQFFESAPRFVLTQLIFVFFFPKLGLLVSCSQDVYLFFPTVGD